MYMYNGNSIKNNNHNRLNEDGILHFSPWFPGSYQHVSHLSKALLNLVTKRHTVCLWTTSV